MATFYDAAILAALAIDWATAVVISIADTGGGIPEDIRARIMAGYVEHPLGAAQLARIDFGV